MKQRVPVQTFEVTTPNVDGSARAIGKFLTDNPTIKVVGHPDPLQMDRVLAATGAVRVQAKRPHSKVRDAWEPVDIVVKLTPAPAGSPKDRAPSS